jgi:hypothetical protein
VTACEPKDTTSSDWQSTTIQLLSLW